ncbi:MAG: hypothetical protein V1868_01805 [Patescibacteria group bacterium]
MFNLSEEYRSFWSEGKNTILTKGVNIVPGLLPVKEDKRRGLGLFFWQSKIKDKTQNILQLLQSEFPDELAIYGLPKSPAQQHITFLELIATQPDYESTYQHLEPKYLEIAQEVLKQASPIKAEFRGVIANQDTIVIKGFPINDDYNNIREELRSKIAEVGLPPLKRRKVKIFHTTIARFLKPIKEAEKFVKLIDSLKDVEIGEDTYQTVHLTRASWLMAKQQVSDLDSIKLR